MPEHLNQSGYLKRGRPIILLLTTIIALIVSSAPVSVPALSEWQYNNKINSLAYKQTHGYWETLPIPEEFKLNTIHAALLPTGKVLLVAGSGNNLQNFNSFYDNGQIAVLKTALFDPADNSFKLVETPSDLFCSGHALLHSGSLLVAGGTVGYEKLDGTVTKPAGTMLIQNEDPDSAVKTLKKGTRFTGPTGKVYVSLADAVIQPAEKMDMDGMVMVHHSTAKVFVEAVSADDSYITNKNEKFKIAGLKGDDTHNLYGQGGPMTLAKQDFRGDDQSFEFNPFTEKYEKVGDMHEGRWYPSLPVLTDGKVLAVSGLDKTGQITDTTEYYSPETKQWTWGPTRAIPTYPALFRTMDPDVLFFSGSNAGYGPQDKGRDPGFWNLKTNQFTPVAGLRDQGILETSASVALPPAAGSNDGSQDGRIMVAGGGGIGESKLVTGRTDIIDITASKPVFTPGPDLPAAVRYLNMTVMPNDTVFATGGTSDYRARYNSYVYKSFSYNPASNAITEMADATVGRGYHSGSLLLPDGRVLVFGGDPLYADKDNTKAGVFEKRIEIYTPPEHFKGPQPSLAVTTGTEATRGQTLTLASNEASSVETARLIPPSTTTHVTNVEQRSVGVVVHKDNGKLTIDMPTDENLLPDGYYMLFVTNKQGISSKAVMIDIR